MRVLTLYCFFSFHFEPSNLSRAHFVLGEKKEGEVKGRDCLKLLNHVTEKKKKLLLQDYLCRKDNGQFDMVDFLQDQFSIVKLYKHIEKNFMPAEETGIEVGRFFRRHASNKEMKVCYFIFSFHFNRLLKFVFLFYVY